MELEEKVKKLVKEFPGLSKLLIRRTLCDDDVREDLTEARQRLQKFAKGPFLSNPAAAADDKELERDFHISHLDGLSNMRGTLCEEGDAPVIKNSFRDSLDGSVVRGASAKSGLTTTAIGYQPTPFHLPNTEERALNGRQAGFVPELSNLVSTGLKFAGQPKYFASENSEILRKRSVIDSNTKLGGMQERTNARQVPDPPKPKPKPNWRKQQESNENYRELKATPAVASGVQAGPPTLPFSQMQSLLSSTLQRKRLAPPPPTPSLHAQSRLPMTPDEQLGPPTTPLRKQSLLPSTSQSERAPSPPPPTIPLRVQSRPSGSQARKRLAPSPPNLSQKEQLPPATPPHKQSVLSPPQAPPPPPLLLHAPAMPQLRPKQLRQQHSNKSFPDSNDTVTDKISKRDDAASKDSKNMNADLTDLEEKVRKLKEEFSSLPKVLIKKTLCGDDIAGDLLLARERLQDFNELKDLGDRFISSGAGEVAIGKLNRVLTISPPLAGRSSSRPEEQSMTAGRGGRGNLLPENWTPMPRDDRGNDVSVHLVELDMSSSEYQEVEDRVLETANHPIEIVSKERVQNPFLYQTYQLAKQKVERNNGESNERQLFHGTSPVNIKKINAQGFDRSLSGSAHGALYGAGVYFARDASYSINYATQPSAGTHRVMYLARVVVGQYCKGEKSMRKPPPVNLEYPEMLFDSMVDKLGDPSIFVVYFDYHSYPEYLISFDLRK